MADAPTFETFVASERARINKERDSLRTKKQEIDTKLAALDRELLAITAYENAKAGRTTTTTRATSAGGTRRTGQREAVLALIKSHPDGISPSAILREMKAESGAEKTSVRNALSALKRKNAVGTKGGSYFAA